MTREEYYSNNLILPPECDALCPYRPCYNKYEAQGSFSMGKGYTSYSTFFRPVCATRQNSGCPEWRNEVGDKANLSRAVAAAQSLLINHRSGKKKQDNLAREHAFGILGLVAKLLYKMRKDDYTLYVQLSP